MKPWCRHCQAEYKCQQVEQCGLRFQCACGTWYTCRELMEAEARIEAYTRTEREPPTDWGSQLSRAIERTINEEIKKVSAPDTCDCGSPRCTWTGSAFCWKGLR